MKSVHPFAVSLGAPNALLSYAVDKKARTLCCNEMAYARSVKAGREVGPSDTTWRIVPPMVAVAVAVPVQPSCGSSVAAVPSTSVEAASAGMGAGASELAERSLPRSLPHTLSVVNTNGRVLVWRGERPRSAAEAAARGPTDLLARVRSAVHGLQGPTEPANRRRFQIEVHDGLLAAARREAGELPFFLAIALEAFWSQGARCHSVEVVGVRAESTVAGGADVRRNSSVVRDTFAGRGSVLK